METVAVRTKRHMLDCRLTPIAEFIFVPLYCPVYVLSMFYVSVGIILLLQICTTTSHCGIGTAAMLKIKRLSRELNYFKDEKYFSDIKSKVVKNIKYIATFQIS